MHADTDMALRALTDTQFRASAEFRSWLTDPGHRRLFRETMDAREAMLRLDPERQPDTASALRRIRSRLGITPTRRHVISNRWAWMGAAASIIIIMCIGITLALRIPDSKPLADKYSGAMPVYVFPASSEPQQILLSLDDGRNIAVLPRNERRLGKEGIEYSSYGITYNTVCDASVPTEQHTLSTPRGQTFKLELEDGTVVWLNSESRLTYPNHFTGTERRVRLEGEAYFQVTHNAAKPFIVATETAETRVLGTEFNVKAYPGKDCNVTLVRGSVLVSATADSHQLVLTPGENATVSRTGKGLTAASVDVMERTAWKDHFFCFRNEELTDIMKEIGHWYNLEVVFTNEKSMHYHFNFWANKDASVESTIHLLNEVGKVQAQVRNGRIIVN